MVDVRCLAQQNACVIHDSRLGNLFLERAIRRPTTAVCAAGAATIDTTTVEFSTENDCALVGHPVPSGKAPSGDRLAWFSVRNSRCLVAICYITTHDGTTTVVSIVHRGGEIGAAGDMSFVFVWCMVGTKMVGVV